MPGVEKLRGRFVAAGTVTYLYSLLSLKETGPADDAVAAARSGRLE